MFGLTGDVIKGIIEQHNNVCTEKTFNNVNGCLISSAVELMSSLLLSFLLAFLDFLSVPPLLGGWLVRFPFESVGVNLSSLGSISHLSHVLLDQILLLQNHVLAFPVLDHAQVLQGADNVVRVDSHLLAKVLDRELFLRVIANVFQDHILKQMFLVTLRYLFFSTALIYSPSSMLCR